MSLISLFLLIHFGYQSNSGTQFPSGAPTYAPTHYVIPFQVPKSEPATAIEFTMSTGGTVVTLSSGDDVVFTDPGVGLATTITMKYNWDSLIPTMYCYTCIRQITMSVDGVYRDCYSYNGGSQALAQTLSVTYTSDGSSKYIYVDSYLQYDCSDVTAFPQAIIGLIKSSTLEPTSMPSVTTSSPIISPSFPSYPPTNAPSHLPTNPTLIPTILPSNTPTLPSYPPSIQTAPPSIDIASAVAVFTDDQGIVTCTPFDHVAQTNGVNLGWIKIMSCTEGGSGSANFTWYHDVLTFAADAVSMKLVPPGASITDADYDAFAVETVPYSNPIDAINAGYEASYQYDKSTGATQQGYSDLNNWIGSIAAKNRLKNWCYQDSEQLINKIYFGCGNTNGIHILPMVAMCGWERAPYSITGKDIDLFFGFEMKRCPPSNAPTTASSASTRDPTAAPSNVPTPRGDTKAPTIFPSPLPTEIPSPFTVPPTLQPFSHIIANRPSASVSPTLLQTEVTYTVSFTHTSDTTADKEDQDEGSNGATNLSGNMTFWVLSLIALFVLLIAMIWLKFICRNCKKRVAARVQILMARKEVASNETAPDTATEMTEKERKSSDVVRGPGFSISDRPGIGPDAVEIPGEMEGSLNNLPASIKDAPGHVVIDDADDEWDMSICAGCLQSKMCKIVYLFDEVLNLCNECGKEFDGSKLNTNVLEPQDIGSKSENGAPRLSHTTRGDV